MSDAPEDAIRGDRKRATGMLARPRMGISPAQEQEMQVKAHQAVVTTAAVARTKGGRVAIAAGLATALGTLAQGVAALIEALR
jgi:hypothetical protein